MLPKSGRPRVNRCQGKAGSGSEVTLLPKHDCGGLARSRLLPDLGLKLKMPILGIKIPKMGRHPKSVKSKRPPERASGIRGVTRTAPAGLADALFSTTQQRVLRLLFGQPGRSFFATELIELTKSGSGGVQRELLRLAESGLVTVTRVGNQKHFQANPAAPLFNELHSIVIKTVGLREPLKAALLPFTNRIRLAVVYGSVAKRTDTASSDVDLLIVSDDLSLEEVYGALGPVEREIARKISPTVYRSEEFRRRRQAENSFVTKLLTGEHIVLFGDEHAVVKP
jgi:predicted nucleotidyltransferase